MSFSSSSSNNSFTKIPSLPDSLNKEIWLRGRVHKTRVKGSIAFLVLRQQLHTIQCCVLKENFPDKLLFKFIEGLPAESVVDIYGKVCSTSSATSCTVSNLEIQVLQVKLISRSQETLPFSYEEGLVQDRVSTKVRLDHRFMDLRLPVNQILFRMSSKISQEFRGFLSSEGFTEIHTPKISPGVSEGGSEVFSVDYFGQTACLAQSPQLYKQMAVLGDIDKVFEIGPVFRSENSNTHRHLCEFTGLDIEMNIQNSYLEIINLVHEMLLKIFEKIESIQGNELVYKYFNTEKVRVGKELLLLRFDECCKMIVEAGGIQGEMEDFTTENEKLLGRIVKDKHGVDFYVIHQYPTNIRPFYTLPSETNPLFSCSFDFFLRGEEIASGSQRIHDYESLHNSAVSRGISTESISTYLNCFKYGAFPHGGCGLGLERILMLYTGLNNIRLASLFPRDPKRLSP